MYNINYTKGALLMHLKLRKWGNSWGLRLPIQVLQFMNIDPKNTEFELAQKDGNFVLKPIKTEGN